MYTAVHQCMPSVQTKGLQDLKAFLLPLSLSLSLISRLLDPDKEHWFLCNYFFSSTTTGWFFLHAFKSVCLSAAAGCHGLSECAMCFPVHEWAFVCVCMFSYMSNFTAFFTLYELFPHEHSLCICMWGFFFFFCIVVFSHSIQTLGVMG